LNQTNSSNSTQALPEKKPVQAPLSVVQTTAPAQKNEVEEMHNILKDVLGDDSLVNFP
jgi:hypothetical protein